MKSVNVFEMARRHETLSGEVSVATLPRLAAALVNTDSTVAYKAQGFIDAQARPSMRLAIEVALPLLCNRCEQPLLLDIEAESVFYFVNSQERLDEEPIDDTPEEALLGSEQFDLAELIEDEAILALPLAPRHEFCSPAPAKKGAGARPAVSPVPERKHPFADLASLRDQLRVEASPAEVPPANPTGPDGTTRH